MSNQNQVVFFMLVCSSCIVLGGCAARAGGNTGNVQSYAFQNIEPEWIRNGDPIKFDGLLWYPEDGIETMTDIEVMPVFEQNGTTIFIDRIDVKPYDRLYTKFGINKYRYFKPRKE